MNAQTLRQTIAGPAGTIECAIDAPEGAPRGLAVICHPHPQGGGTMDNKVVQTLARAAVQLSWRAARFNFRGIGASEGQWDEGRGEVDDAMAVIRALRAEGEPLLLAGFSFGGYVAAEASRRVASGNASAQQLVLVAPAVVNFAVGEVPAGTLVFHGEADEVVPLTAALDWARPQHQPITVLPGVGHFFHGQLALLKQLLLRSLASS